MPAREKACSTQGEHATDVEFHMGKQDSSSMCICTTGAHIASTEANLVAAASDARVRGDWALFTLWLVKRRRAAYLATL